jgi:hypothetical protein
MAGDDGAVMDGEDGEKGEGPEAIERGVKRTGLWV